MRFGEGETVAGRYGLEIRTAVSADGAGLAELMSASGLAWSERALSERLDLVRRQPGAVLVAMEWGPPSGVIHIAWRATLQADQLKGRIEFLLVAPQARRRGLGRLLLKAGAQAARAAGCNDLEIAANVQTELAAFCAAAGFVNRGASFVRPLRKGG